MQRCGTNKLTLSLSSHTNMQIYVFYISNIRNNAKKLKYFVTSQPLAVMSIITVYCEVTAYTQLGDNVRLEAFNRAVAKYSSLLGRDTSISQHTVLNCLILKVKTLHFFKMSELSCPVTQCPRTISPNDNVPELSHPMTVSQNYLTQWQCPRTTSNNDTVSQNYLTQWHSVPELSHPMTVSQNYLTQSQCPRTTSPNHTVSQNYITQWQCPRTTSNNDTVSQNYLTQSHSAPELPRLITQCPRTILPNDSVPEPPQTMTVFQN